MGKTRLEAFSDDVIAINKSTLVTYSVTDDDTTAPSLTSFSVADQTDAQVAAGGYTTIAMLLEAEAVTYLEATGLPWIAVGPDGALHSS